MSAQLLEILFLAGIAFLIISKFISILGTTDDDDPARGNTNSCFGERRTLKDVTGTSANSGSDAADILRIAKKVKKLDDEAADHLKPIFAVMPDFDCEKFLYGAKGAFNMLVTALDEKDSKTIEELVDKRFLSHFKKADNLYGKILSEKMKASIVESYSFGNNIYVKVLFEGDNITDKMSVLKEEWVFTKNINQAGPEWFLSNIDR